MNLGGVTSKSKILPLKQFVSTAGTFYQNLRNLLVIEEKPSDELTSFLDFEDTHLAKLKDHIEAEKARVEAGFKQIMKEFYKMCAEAQAEMLENLDRQYINLKSNYDYYRSKINRYYKSETSGKEDEDELILSESKIYEKINECETIDDFEVLVKNILDDFEENEGLKNETNKLAAIKDSMKTLNEDIKAQLKAIPTTVFNEIKSVSDHVSKLEDCVKDYLEKTKQIEPELYQLSMSKGMGFDSKSVTKANEKNFIKTKVLKKTGF
mmetsp:Transcript_7338/g.6682  ORF Transcript_7338/g.6682 Transcript_7338/m.6682 type:complete len:266 (-) Transcript_7338:381-1178(-)